MVLFPLEALDQRLGEVRTAVDRMGRNLFDLDSDTTRQVLDVAPLSGVTAAAWAGAAGRLADLWQAHRVLSDLVAEISARRASKRRFSDDQLAELERRLHGPSIRLAGAFLDPASRTMTGAETSETVWTIDGLLKATSSTFDALAGTVAQAGAVWDQVTPEVERLDLALDALRARAATAGVRWSNEANAIRQHLLALREEAAVDPLGVDPDVVAAAVGDVDRVTRRVNETIRGAEEVSATLASAEATIAAATDLVSDADVAAKEAAVKITGSATRPPDLDRVRAELDQLRIEVAAIREVAGAEREVAARRAAAVGQRIATLQAEAARAREAASAGLATRAELRGRLDAYRAKAHASGRAEDLELDRLYQEAEHTLYVSPCDLGAAAGAVARYQQALRHPPERSQTEPVDR
ncbi:MAG: hypothetical protein M3Y91_07230 [Actinomycetota bacterium]|nr:hypothetical protein [Actinomycetota bacterium]